MSESATSAKCSRTSPREIGTIGSKPRRNCAELTALPTARTFVCIATEVGLSPLRSLHCLKTLMRQNTGLLPDLRARTLTQMSRLSCTNCLSDPCPSSRRGGKLTETLTECQHIGCTSKGPGNTKCRWIPLRPLLNPNRHSHPKPRLSL